MKWLCVWALAIAAPAQEVQLAEIASGFSRPTDIQQPDDGSGRLFVLEQAGRVRVVRGGAPQLVMDITDRVTQINAGGDERGLLGMAFPPSFKTKQYFYLNYTNRNGTTTISRFRMMAADADTADPASEQVLLTVSQPFANHNGGQLQFGPDGFLYIGMGDGGSANDPQRNAQSPQSLLGKMLRIDVESSPSGYTVPSSNPFRNNMQYRPEIWATGLRNPWRFSFDPATGNLFIGDVGQGRAEEIDLQLKSSTGGENYGWNVMEGTSCLISPCNQIGVRPIFEYPHSEGNISITGGYVYRGTISPTLRGLYIYADYASGRIWTLGQENNVWTSQLLIRPSNFTVSTFGQDRNGEVYVANYGAGIIYRIQATGPPVLTSSSVVNGASYVVGMTPGSAASAFVSGAKYTPGVTAASSLPLPTTLEDLAVLVNDTPAPLYAVANVGGVEQINFQTPFELAGATAARVAVRRGNATGAAIDIPVYEIQPAVFTQDGTNAIVVHAADNTLVTADSPLQPGENVYFYATGLGPLDITPPTGAAAPSSPLSRAKTRPTVTIGGQVCSVGFAGLAPELAGVYQVNLTIPINIPSGQQDLVITAGSTPSPVVRVPAR